MRNKIDPVDMPAYINFLEAWIDILKRKNIRNKKLKDADWIRLNPFVGDMIANIKSNYHDTDIDVGLKHSIEPNGMLSVADKLQVDPVELRLALEVMCNTDDARYDEPNHCYYVR